MKKEIISSKQAVMMILMFMIGSTLVIGGSSTAKQDAGIAIFLSVCMAFPIFFIYARLLQLFPNKNLFDIIEQVFGKFIGKIMIVLFSWYFFHLGALVLRNITEFVQIVSFPETPQFFVAFCIGILLIYMIYSGLEVLGRFIEFILPIILVVIISTIAISLGKSNVTNLKPMLYNGWQPILKTSFLLLTFPFAETIIFTTIFDSLPAKTNPYKIYFLSLLMGGFLLLVIALRNILVLGTSNIFNHYFPTYSAVLVISIGKFLERIEIIVSIVFILSSFVKTNLFLLGASIGFSKIFHFDDYRQITAPLCFLMLMLSFILYHSVMEIFEWLEIYPYYAIFFQVILPVLLLIVAEIKTRLSMTKKGSPS